jgi:hypothetical protein
MPNADDVVSVHRDIRAPAGDVWAMVADVTRMGEWSPEAVSAKWLDGADGPAPGARFRGRNRNGVFRWSTVSTITECEPGRVVEFRAGKLGLPIARWRYQLEDAEDGCRVTETWFDERGRLIVVLGRVASGVGDRRAHNRAGMEETLRRLATAAEGSS